MPSTHRARALFLRFHVPRHLWRLVLHLGALGMTLAGSVGLQAADSVIISEVLANNTGGLADEDGGHPDWIELFNSTSASVNLDGWFLTDTASDLAKFRLPATNISPGGFLVVFASGKSRALPGQPIHTNFKLSSDGEYLALIHPNGVEVASEFSPTYPPQSANISYGLAQDVLTTLLVSNASPARVLVPGGDIGLKWTTTDFDDGKWLLATNGVGYQSFVAGFAVRSIKANVGVCDMGTAESVLASPSLQASSISETARTVNYLNSGSGANFPGDVTFPGLTIQVDADNFVLEATGIVTIPSSGTWTFGVNSDDGFSVTLGTNTFSHPSPRGPGDTFATFTLAAGELPVRLVFYECGGGSEVEFFAAKGTSSAFNSNFRLVGDTAAGGLAVKSAPVGSSGNDFGPFIATDIQSRMLNRSSSAYIRLPLWMEDPSALSSLNLRIQYVDGFVAYLNGIEIARRHAPAAPAWNSKATLNRSNALAIAAEDISVSSFLGLLVPGTNVLAVHGLNDSVTSPEFLQRVELGQYQVIGTSRHYFSKPTPGAPNTSDSLAFSQPIGFSPERGWYTNTTYVSLTPPTPGTVIRYTLDGSAPTPTTGLVYSEPIPVTNSLAIRAIGVQAGFESGIPATHSYIFPAQVARQTGAGFPANWGGVAAEYALDPAIVNDPQWAATLVDDLLSIPTLSIVMKSDDLLGPNGIYVNTDATGALWERACSLEYMRPDGRKGFQENCAIRVQGGASRSVMRKHGLRVLFKKAFGAGKLSYDLFPESPVKEFDTLTLHASFNDHWGWVGSAAQLQRDMWCRDTQNAMGGYGPHGTYVHLYLNGLYWGLYNMGEKGDASFASHYLGGDKTEYDALNSDEVIDGDGQAWSTLMSLIASGVRTDVDFANVSAYLNVPNFIDYLLMNFYSANIDWPWHNWNASRRRTPGAGFHFFSWDAEWTFFIGSDAGTDRTGITDGSVGAIYTALRAHPEFRRLFGDHAQRHLFNDGVLTPAACDARWMRRAEEIDRAIIPETARWGYGNTHNTWLAEQALVRGGWFPGRTATLISQLRSAGLLPATLAPVFAPHGGLIPPDFSLILTNPNPAGVLYYTIDGGDPRLWGGGIAPSARVYTQPLLVTNAMTLSTRVLRNSEWSPLEEATFYVSQDYSALAVTEIMYRPASSPSWSSEDYQFIELKNSGIVPLELSGLQFTSGIDFKFTNGTRIPPGGFLVLARNPVAFASRYPTVTLGGVFSNRLDKAGESLVLSHLLGNEVLRVTYGAQPPWPLAANGFGFSLVPRQAGGSGSPLNSPAGWRASFAVNGSPGQDDIEPRIPPVVINEVRSQTRENSAEAVELFNPGDTPADIGGWFLSDDATVPTKFRIPVDLVLPPKGYRVFRGPDFDPTPGVPPSFTVSLRGGSLHLTSGEASGHLTGYNHSIEFGASGNLTTLGRMVLSSGEENWPTQIRSTLGSTNSGPRVGPVIINEIMFHPPLGHDEFIELYNTSGAPVAFWEPTNPTNTWRLSGAGYRFPTNFILPSHTYLVIAASDPAAFRTKYNVPLAVEVLGPFSGSLADSGERLGLEAPDVPFVETNGVTVVPYLTVDEVRFKDSLPWPTGTAGAGPSLQRRAPLLYGNEPTNWFASGITPGTSNSLNLAPVVSLQFPREGSRFQVPESITVRADAHDDDGSILQVDFLDGDVVIGSTTRRPFTLIWAPPAGIHLLMARARDNRLAVASSAPVTITVEPPPIGNGTGLQADYYDNFDFTGTKVRRVDPIVNFDWADGSPDPLIGADTFSARWTGSVQPRFSETYTFYTVSDDGIRLWVNNKLIVDNWNDHGPTENSGYVALKGGFLYNVRMEMYESGGGAVAKLFWSAPSVPKEVIPSTQLYPPSKSNVPPNISLDSPKGGVLFTDGPINLVATANDSDGSIQSVEFFDGIRSLGVVSQPPYTFSWTNASSDTHVLRAIATDNSSLSSTSAPVSVTTLARLTHVSQWVASGDVWSYRDTGENLGSAWVGADYDDALWSSGPACLGYGRGDERTLVSFGPDIRKKFVTTYFRKAFLIPPDNGETSEVVLRLLRNNGAAVYLNGIEVNRSNLPDGPIDYRTLARTNIQDGTTTTYFTVNLSPNSLLVGTNMVAVELHQASETNSELAFDLELIATNRIVAPYVEVQPSSLSLLVGQSAFLNVGAEGTPPLKYQWRFNDAPIAGATGTSLALGAVGLAAAGNYSVIITNQAGVAISQIAILAVTNPDTDGDGIPDWWELANGTNPNLDDAESDLDRDGMTNQQEFEAGTNPGDPASFLRVNRILPGETSVTIEFLAAANHGYTVLYKNGVEEQAWHRLVNIEPTPNSRWRTVVDTYATNHSRFYRLVTPKQP